MVCPTTEELVTVVALMRREAVFNDDMEPERITEIREHLASDCRWCVLSFDLINHYWDEVDSDELDMNASSNLR